MPLEILFAGNYEPDYNRTAVIRSGLLKLGHRVREYPFKKKNYAAGRELRSLAGRLAESAYNRIWRDYDGARTSAG